MRGSITDESDFLTSGSGSLFPLHGDHRPPATNSPEAWYQVELERAARARHRLSEEQACMGRCQQYYEEDGEVVTPPPKLPSEKKRISPWNKGRGGPICFWQEV